MVDIVMQYFEGSHEKMLIFFYVLDFLIVMIQFKIIDKIWTKKKHVQEFEVSILMMVIFFNPLQLSSPST